MNTPRILIVDDDPALLQALPQALLLRLSDIHIDICDTVQDALGLIHQHDYEVIVSDIKMPGMDGLDLLLLVKERRPDTPVILITGHGEHNLAIRALRGGAYDYIQKPIDRDSFVAAIQRGIQTHQLRRQIADQQLALALHARALERLIQQRTRELIEANETKDKFLTIISHELEIPLEHLKGMAHLFHELLEHERAVLAVKQGLADMEQAIERTQTLVQNLLDVSLMDSNMFVLKRKRSNLVELCHHFLTEYTRGMGPVLISEFLDEPVEVEIDEERISQALLNLLSNARKYSPKGSPITITIQQSGYEAMLRVRDAGNGIPTNKLPTLFKQFLQGSEDGPQRGQYNRSNQQGGFGLGLYVVRKIIERHSGRVEVISKSDQGSVFTLILPLLIDPAARDFGAIPSFTPQLRAEWTLID